LSRFGNMRKWRDKLSASWRHSLGGAILTASLGLLALALWRELRLLGYDLLFLPWKATPHIEDVCIVYMDDRAFKDLKQASMKSWDLKLHSALLDQLTRDGARLVVFDVVFTYDTISTDKTRFAEAIRQNRKVVLAASLDQRKLHQFESKGPVYAWDEIADAAAASGVAEIDAPRDAIARQYIRGPEWSDAWPSLPWAAAVVAKLPIATQAGARQPDIWLNYYGPALSLPWFSYGEALSQPPGAFKDKMVFIGAQPKTLKLHDEADVIRTPHSLWGLDLFPGVEVCATTFLNFARGDGFVRLAAPVQAGIVFLSGLMLGALLSQFRPWPAAGIAVLSILICLVAVLQVAKHHYWFGWTAIAFVQIPCSLAWSIGSRVVHLKFEKDVLTRTLEETTKLVEATKATARQKPAQMIPDHTLVKRIGKGAYGEVWLARNAVGVYHAAKIVQRRGFPADEPYEREFRGIQKFMPVSRSQPGFVHIHHVGRNDEERYFFCVMEAGDDKTAGQRIDPETYSPKTLGTELEWRGKIIPEECLQLGLALTLALEHLHQSQLIHRDIKPSNIIYVNGAPKFADIGLVTDIRSAGHDVSFLGTEGYIAPEGPGTASADVYALGKVLYEAAMGRDRRLFPEVPTAVLEEPSEGLLRRLNEVIFKACEMAANERYQTAGEMHADLLALQSLVKQRNG
jgi:CHASE2 domain-containing sensor protein